MFCAWSYQSNYGIKTISLFLYYRVNKFCNIQPLAKFPMLWNNLCSYAKSHTILKIHLPYIFYFSLNMQSGVHLSTEFSGSLQIIDWQNPVVLKQESRAKVLNYFAEQNTTADSIHFYLSYEVHDC